MQFDVTGISIIVGVISAVIYFVVELIRHKELEVINGGIVFLAVFAIASSSNLISVAMTGNLDELPTAWREHIAIAGVIGIGLSVQQIICIIKKLFSPRVHSARRANKAENNRKS